MIGKRKKHQSVKGVNASPGGAGTPSGASPMPTAVASVAAPGDAEDGDAAEVSATAVVAVEESPAPPVAVATPAADGEGTPAEGEEGTKSGKRARSRGSLTPRWSSAEEQQLLALRAELGDRAWRAIAEKLGTGRTASGVEQHWCAPSPSERPRPLPPSPRRETRISPQSEPASIRTRTPLLPPRCTVSSMGVRPACSHPVDHPPPLTPQANNGRQTATPLGWWTASRRCRR